MQIFSAPRPDKLSRGRPANGNGSTTFDAKQQAFLDFVLQNYVNVGVNELDPSKLSPLLKLRYHDSITDAVADLGSPDTNSAMFTGFQKYLSQEVG